MSVSGDPRGKAAFSQWWRDKIRAAERAGVFPQPLILPDPDDPVQDETGANTSPPESNPTGFSPAP